MSLVVNLIFSKVGEGEQAPGMVLAHIEDAKTGEILHHVGHWVEIEDGLYGLQLRVMHLDEHLIDGINICPSCNRIIPPPPPDLTWKRSLP